MEQIQSHYYPNPIIRYSRVFMITEVTFCEKMDQHKTETNLLERILGDNNTTEKLDIERKEVQENSNTVDFDKNLQNITDNRQYSRALSKYFC